jgi:hypothetical protein
MMSYDMTCYQSDVREVSSDTMASKEAEREEMKEETHDIEDAEQDELDEADQEGESE